MIVPAPAVESVVTTVQPVVVDAKVYNPAPEPPETPRVMGVPAIPVIETGMIVSEDCATGVKVNVKVTAAEVAELYIPFAAFVATTMQVPT